MNFLETKLKGAFIIEMMRLEDERGYFARSFCQDEFQQEGLNPCVAQCNVSFNLHKGTIRGMHYQDYPYWEVKLVRCTRGMIFDVIIDLRPDSPTYLEWTGVKLSPENYRLIYIPEGFAHGFQTIEDNTEVIYQMSECYHPECSKGVKWDDPTFDIDWPISDVIVSEKDTNFPWWRVR